MSKRLGCKNEGIEELKKHKFFVGVDWENLTTCSVVPPNVPLLKHDADVSKIDPEFLEEDVANDSVLNAKQTALEVKHASDTDIPNF